MDLLDLIPLDNEELRQIAQAETSHMLDLPVACRFWCLSKFPRSSGGWCFRPTRHLGKHFTDPFNVLGFSFD